MCALTFAGRLGPSSSLPSRSMLPKRHHQKPPPRHALFDIIPNATCNKFHASSEWSVAWLPHVAAPTVPSSGEMGEARWRSAQRRSFFRTSMSLVLDVPRMPSFWQPPQCSESMLLLQENAPSSSDHFWIFLVTEKGRWWMLSRSL